MTILRQLLNLTAKLIALILAVGLVVGLMVTLVAFNVEQIVFQPAYLKDVLVKNQVYTEVLPPLIQGFIRQQIIESGMMREVEGPQAGGGGKQQLPIDEVFRYLDDEDWQFLVNALLPPAWLQTQVEGAIEAMFVWLDSDAPLPTTVIDLRPVEQQFDETTRQQLARRLVTSWPECTEEQIETLAAHASDGSLNNIPVCQPVGNDASLLEQQIVTVAIGLEDVIQESDLPNQLDLVGLAVSPTDAESDVFTEAGLARFKQNARWAQARARWSPLLPLGLLLLVALFGVRTWADLFRWWGVPLFVGGLLTLLLVLVLPTTLELGILAALAVLPAEVRTIVPEIARSVMTVTARAIGVQAGVITGTGLLFIFASFLLAEKGKARPGAAVAPARADEIEVRFGEISLAGSLRPLARHLKLRRAVRLTLRALWVALLVFAAGVWATTRYAPAYSRTIQEGVALVLLVGVIWALWAWVPLGRLARRLDARFALRDQLTAALEVETSGRGTGYLEGVLLDQAANTLDRVRHEITYWPHLPWHEVQTLLAAGAIVGAALYTSVGSTTLSNPTPQPLPPAGSEFLAGEATNPRLAYPPTWPAFEPQADEAPEPLPPNAVQETMERLAEALSDEAVAAEVVQAFQRGDPQAAAEALRRLADQSDALSDATLDALAEAMRQAAAQMSETAPHLAPQLERTAGVLDGTGTAAQALHEGAEQLSELSPMFAELLEQMSKNVAANDYAAAAEMLQQAADLIALLDPELAQGLESLVAAVTQEDTQAIAEALQRAAEAMQTTDPGLARELDKTARALEGRTPGLAARSLEDLAEAVAALDPTVDAAHLTGEAAGGGGNGSQAGEGQTGGTGAGMGAGTMVSDSEGETSEMDLESLSVETLPVELDPAQAGGQPGTGPLEGPPSVSFSSPAGFVPATQSSDELSRTGQDPLAYPHELTDVVRTYFSPPR